MEAKKQQHIQKGIAELQKNLKDIVTAYRAKTGETQAVFAHACGLSESLICDIEASCADPYLSQTNAIANHMGMSQIELLTLMDPHF